MASKDLKITFSGDTKSYRQEVDKAAIATNKFKKDAGSSMTDLAGVFGVNVSQIKGNIDGLSKGFTMMMTSMKASAEGATVFSAAMNVIKVAAISTGLGALVVALGSLIAYFTQTREGANFVKTAMAALGAAVRVVIDHFSSFGEGIFKLFKGDWAGSMEAFKKSFTGIGTEIMADATAAAELERRTQALNKAERESKVVNAEKAAQAAELRKEAKDKENFDAADRRKKLYEARDLIKSVAEDEIKIAKERLAIFQGQMALRKASSDDLNTEVDLKMKVSELDRESAMEQKALFRELNGVTKEITAQTDAIKKKAEEERKALMGKKPEFMQGSAGIWKYTNETEIKTTYNKDQDKANKDMQAHMESYAAQSKAIQDDLSKSTLDFSSTMNGAWASASEGLGEFIGNLMAGTGSISDFGTFVAMQFADLAVTVGKQMIAFGATGIALKMLIKNPWTALAAGIALVALGTAAKSKISASISGGGASSATGGGGGDYNYDARQSMGSSKMQTVNVVVTGELKAHGGSLVTVLNQENQRKSIVT